MNDPPKMVYRSTDYNKGLLSDSVITNAFKKLGIKRNTRKADALVLDILGYRLYNKYKDND